MRTPEKLRVRPTKKSIFYRIYFAVLAVFVLLLVAGLFALHTFLKSYNETIPETISARFFEAAFLAQSPDELIRLSGLTPSEFESEQQLSAYIQRVLEEAPLTYTSISSGSDTGVKKYIVKSGEYKLADFTLTKNESTKAWEPASLTLHLPSTNVYTYRLFDCGDRYAVLYLNGVRVSADYRTERVAHENASYLPSDVSQPTWSTYTIPNLTDEPEVRALDRNGNEVTFELIDGVYTEMLAPDPAEEALAAYLTEAAKQYAKCMQNDASKASALKYFEKGTDLYNSIRTADNMFVWSHDGYDFENVQTSEFFRYDENTVSLRVSFTHILRKGSKQYRDHTDITYFAHKVEPDGDYKIFARYNN